MSPAPDTNSDARIVAAQIGREPRRPWRVGSRCVFGYPSTIVSPSRLEDGSPFPSLAWLTCPFLAEYAGSLESGGAAADWTRRAARDETLAERLRSTDSALREARAVESGGVDACDTTGIAGQRDPLKVKCVHAHVALAVVGMPDPIGAEVLGNSGVVCPDRRCDRLLEEAVGESGE